MANISTAKGTMYLSRKFYDKNKDLIDNWVKYYQTPQNYEYYGFAYMKIEEVTEDEFNKVKTTATSAVGHQDTANVLGVKMNRISLKLKENDVLYVAELQGGRLPEGVITLPKDFTFKYIKCKIL